MRLINCLKIVSYIITGFLFAGLFFIFTIGLLFNLFFKSPDTNLGTIPSPNGRFEAILMRNNPPAFASYNYVLYLIKKGDKCDKNHIVLTGNRFGHLPKIYWKNLKELIVEYDSGHVSNFDDSALFNEKTAEYDVRVKLIYSDSSISK